ncbi:hypothetical protein [Longimicrobium sp.]|jgi:hypothetical protein|uniref:hypothetical protein n=1 Tax=Longimicrobium sp. TaxID=2029185 RepID=UPI002ED8C343
MTTPTATDPTAPTVADVRNALDSLSDEQRPDGEITDAQITAAIEAVDPAAIIAAEDAHWTVQLWDRRSPINDAKAEQIFASRDDIPGVGDVVLVLRDDQVTMLQPHLPNVAGIQPIPVGRGAAVGEELRQELARNRASAEVIQGILTHFGVS